MIRLALAAAALALANLPSIAQPARNLTTPRNALDAFAVVVLDGDTIRVDGIAAAIRLVGLNAPETVRPACEREAVVGARATARLRDLVAAGGLALDRVPCACPEGTEGTQACNFGRACGRLYSRGGDVAAVLIAEGLAVPFICAATRCPATPRPWCEGVDR
jgi:endonuclease YncB( thermonuclease family)